MRYQLTVYLGYFLNIADIIVPYVALYETSIVFDRGSLIDNQLIEIACPISAVAHTVL